MILIPEKVLFVFGTRPEAIKMAPLIQKFRNIDSIDTKVCVTGQHREMLDQVLELFNISPDFDLNLMKPNQTLHGLTTSVIDAFTNVINEYKPNLIFVHGDTTTSFAATLASFYTGVRVAHVEAGLRTGDILSPWPEEANRKLTACLASYHFAPTETAKMNLLRESLDKDQICVTGNTVIDALIYINDKIDHESGLLATLQKKFQYLSDSKRTLLVTSHRRENFGEGLNNICEALLCLSHRYHDCEIVFPVHLNPMVKNHVYSSLSNVENIHLIPPQDYLSFVYLMKQSEVILTDSGGIQEEAPALGKPVIVMRDTTERPEAVEAGTVVLSGAKTKEIVSATSNLLDNKQLYQAMARSVNPFGDGTASAKIAAFFNL